MKTIFRIGLWIAVSALLPSCSLFEPPSTAPTSRRVPQPSPAPQNRPPQAPSIPAPVPPAQSVPPEIAPAPVPPREYQFGAASRSLVSQAQSQAAKGDFPIAVGTIERALRIEPDNPLLWLEMSKVRYAAGNYVQAESTARKTLSLSTGNVRIQSAAWQQIAKSLRARGKADEALDADTRAYALTPQ